MERRWNSLPATDPAYQLHAVLHDAVDQWIVAKRHTDASYLLVSMALETNLHGARADVLAKNIIKQVGRGYSAMVKKLSASRE